MDVPVIESYKVLQQLYEIPERQFQENLEKFQDIMGIGSLLSVPERAAFTWTEDAVQYRGGIFT